MYPKISFEEQQLVMGALGEKTSVPDLIGGLILQNRLTFQLGEEDEIYEGYGQCSNSYPYRQCSCYSRKPVECSVKTAILENDFLKAVFLPELGGRLWYLLDKEKNRNLLYTNDVIQFGNLAVRNAWFSGGVEWNMGIIGHSPFTTFPLFTAALQDSKGIPILRMYEYERVRQATFQIDLWLGEQDRFLNARMRIVNPSDEVVPMYWWSNIAVPEHKNGRIIVPADKAYTSKNQTVYKVDIPLADKKDITKYQNIPSSVDYFFEIPKEDPKYIAHVDEDGYGLLHLSTNRLQSRKLFSWGHMQGADHWQEFLTKDAGRYVEIQAGLAKTQYGCLPMAPHTAWEWLERYGAIQLEKDNATETFQELRKKVTGKVLENPAYQEMEQILADTKKLAKEKAKLIQEGSGYAALKNAVRSYEGKPPLSGHLEFGGCQKEQKRWIEFLHTGVFSEADIAEKPESFLSDEVLFQKLKKSVRETEENNWYAHYQLGLFYFQKGAYQKAEKEFYTSLENRENPWSYHAIACVYTVMGEKEKAVETAVQGIGLRKTDLSYLKESFRILSLCSGYEETQKLYESLDAPFRKDGRIKFYYILALSECQREKEAYDLLMADGGLILPDIREGESALAELWQKLYKKLYHKEGEVPYCFDFSSI